MLESNANSTHCVVPTPVADVQQTSVVHVPKRTCWHASVPIAGWNTLVASQAVAAFASVLVLAHAIEISGSLESSRVAEALRTTQANHTTTYANKRRRMY